MKGWVDVKKAAEYADVSERVMRGWLKEGLKYSRRSRKTTRIRYCDIDEFLEQFQVNNHYIDDFVDSVICDFNKKHRKEG